MPGAEKLITFQGSSGNLTKSPWDFKPRGQSGKYVSDLLPHLAELADEMCFIHSMTSKTNTHGPGENFMSTGFTVEGYPSAGAWVSLCPGQRVGRSAGVRGHSRSARHAAVGRGQLVERISAGRLSGNRVQRRAADRQPAARRRASRPAASRPAATFSSCSTRSISTSDASDTELAARIASYELAARLQLSAPEVSDLSSETADTLEAYGANDRRIRSRPASPGIASWPGGCWSGACASSSCSTAPYAMGEGVGNWDGHRTLKAQYDVHAPDSRSAGRRAAEGSEAAGPARRYAGRLDDRVRPHADVSGRTPTAATTIPRALRSGWPAPA